MAKAKEKDLYSVLGVSRSATADDVKKAYRKLARKHHPDLNPGNKQAEERFKEISVAQDVLTDPQKRKLYDEFGHEGLQGGFDPERAREYKRWAESGHGFSFRPGENETFGFEFRGGPRGRGRRAEAEEERTFADFINQMFGAGAAEAPPPARGQDIQHDVEVDFLDALRGTQLPVTVRRPVECPQCKGTGRQGMRACTRCGGTGMIEQRERLTVKIPPGVADGARVRVRGKGGAGAGGATGDLYFIVKVRPHPLVKRDGQDLTLEVPITVGEAIRGATIEVPTPPAGTVRLKVPKGSQSGQRLRLAGRGVRDPKGGSPGDLYVRLMVQVPTNGTSELKDAVETIEGAYAGNPRAHLAF
ncbi:MAG TPA: DnaJ C-terminal domain-containing protein [Candidatus Binatia bacterium]|nr:DnaJ C-terminal domain-containing protein [Candidatus Binatia bacterium]